MNFKIHRTGLWYIYTQVHGTAIEIPNNDNNTRHRYIIRIIQ